MLLRKLSCDIKITFILNQFLISQQFQEMPLFQAEAAIKADGFLREQKIWKSKKEQFIWANWKTRMIKAPQQFSTSLRFQLVGEINQTIIRYDALWGSTYTTWLSESTFCIVYFDIIVCYFFIYINKWRRRWYDNDCSMLMYFIVNEHR